jgi:Na+/glutamate symporter
MDAVVTGVILGGIVASLYGVKKLREKDGHSEDHQDYLVPEHTESPRKKSWIRRLFGR